MKILGFILLFSSSLIAAESPLSFEEALKTIVERSTAIGTQQTNVESTKAKNISSHLSLLPTLSITASQNYNQTLGMTDTANRGIGLQANMNIFKFGADAAAMRAANAEDQTQSFTLEDTILKTEDDGVSALVSAIQTEKTTKTLSQIVIMRTETLRIAHERFQRGLIAAQEADKFSVDLDNAQAQLKDAEIESVRAKNNLRTLLGHDQITYEWPWKDLFTTHPPDIEKLQEDLQKRPDWLAASRRIDGARERASQAWGMIFPSVDLSVSYGYYKLFQPVPEITGPQFVGTASITIPLFDRLVNYGNYKALVETRTAAELELERVKRQAQSDFNTAKGALQISLETAKAREQTLSTSRKLYESNLQRFRRAIVNANELMNDQDRLFSSELLAIKGWAEVHTDFTKLCHARGKRLEQCH